MVILGSKLHWSAVPRYWAVQINSTGAQLLLLEDLGVEKKQYKKGMFFNTTDSRFLPLATASKIIDWPVFIIYLC